MDFIQNDVPSVYIYEYREFDSGTNEGSDNIGLDSWAYNFVKSGKSDKVSAGSRCN